MKPILYVSLLSLFLTSCSMEDSHLSIMVYNDLSDSIAYIRDQRIFIHERPNMFDSLPELNQSIKLIKPYDYYVDEIMLPETHFERFPDGKTRIYFLNVDTLRNYTWKEIRDGSMYLKKYSLSLQDIRDMKNELRIP